MRVFKLTFVKFDTPTSKEEIESAMREKKAEVGLAPSSRSGHMLILTTKPEVAAECKKIIGCRATTPGAPGGTHLCEIPIENPQTKKLLKKIA
jgi:hypothetical protein